MEEVRTAITFTDEEIEAKRKELQRIYNRDYYKKNRDHIRKMYNENKRKKAINALMYEHMQAVKAENANG